MTAAGWELGQAPADDPLSYPGTPPPGDVLLVGRDLLPLTPPRGGGPLGSWAVTVSDVVAATLSEALDGLGAMPMADRTPVVAVGSNRCPAQITRKLNEPARPALGVVPMTRVRVCGFGNGHSAHIGRWGYVPNTPVARPGWHDQWLTWLDPAQLGLINATEVNYHLVAAPYPLVLTADESTPADGWVFYRSKWGALELPPDAHGPSWPMSQHEVYRRLVSLPWFRRLLGRPYSDVAEVVALLRGDEALRDAVRDGMAAYGCAVTDRLGDEDDVRRVPVSPDQRRAGRRADEP